MKHFWFIITLASIIAALLGLPAMAQDDPTNGTVLLEELEFGGYTYEYRIFLPSIYDVDDEAQALPLIIAFHPAGGDGESMARITDFDEYAERDGVIIVYPTSQFGYWDYGYGLEEWESVSNVLDDPGFAEMLYATLLENYNVNRSRVYMVGFSNGSRLVMRLACDHADWFGGAAAVAAGMTSEVANICPEDAQIVMFYQHGTDDATVPWEGKPLLEGGQVVSYAFAATDTATFWALQNGCVLEPEVLDMEDLNPEDQVTIRHVFFNDCESGKPVMFSAVINGGHVWPGAPVLVDADFEISGDTSAYIWDFFGLAEEGSVK